MKGKKPRYMDFFWASIAVIAVLANELYHLTRYFSEIVRQFGRLTAAAGEFLVDLRMSLWETELISNVASYTIRNNAAISSVIDIGLCVIVFLVCLWKGQNEKT